MFVQFLKTFIDITFTFSASLKVNSNLFFGKFTRIKELLFEWMNDKDETSSDMTLSMTTKLNKY